MTEATTMPVRPARRPLTGADGGVDAPVPGDRAVGADRPTGPEPMGVLIRRELRRPHFLVMACMGPLAAVAIAGLQAIGLVASSPIWLIPTILIVGQTMSTLADIRWQSSPTRVRLHARVAAQAIVVTATIYATGWGPALAVGLLVVGQEALTQVGPAAVRAVVGWNISCLTLGEVLLALGWTPSLIPTPEVHGLAILMGIGILFSYRSLVAALREKEAASALVASREQRFRSLVQNGHDLVFVVDTEGSVTYASPSCVEVLGFDPSELLGAETSSIMHPDDIEALRTTISGMLASGDSTCGFLIRVRRADGEWRWLEGAATDRQDEPAVQGLVINARDVTARRTREEQQAVVASLGRTALGEASLQPLIDHASRMITEALAAPCRIIVMDADHRTRELSAPGDCERQSEVAASQTVGVVYPIGDPRRPLAQIEVSPTRALCSDDEHFLEAIASILTSSIVRQRAEDLIRHQALHDPLTGLPNRALLHDRLEHALARAGRAGEGLALLILDLDGFKEINDTLGHDIGDQVLVRLGERLLGSVRASDTVARLGGDEFGVLLEAVESDEDALTLATTIGQAITRPITVDETQLCLAASIGVARCPDHGTTTTDLLKHADIAMYDAKRLGAGAAVYRPEGDEHSALRLTLMSQLGTAIDHGELVVHYQPKIELASGQPVGVEALVRWNHPDLGLIGPDQFVPLAEQSGSIGALTTAVLRASIEQVRHWSSRGIDLDLAVNISARTVHDEHLVRRIVEELERGRLCPERLVLEITETAVMSNPQRVVRSLRQLGDLGVRISLDDFGTGYCSLAYLRDLPIQEIKLDRTYVAGISRGDREASLAHAIIDLGQRLGLDVVAEGIEDIETLDALIAAGATLGQGYLFTRPLAAENLETWLHERANAGPTNRTRLLAHPAATT